MRALTRGPQPARPGVIWIAGTLAHPGDLCTGVDAILHVAGVVNARTRAEFDAGNVAGTATMLAAARAAGVHRFVHVSSLAAREPGLSLYGASKAAAEALVQDSGLDWTIVRPPGVYGPGDREMLGVYRLIARGLAVVPGAGRFSLIEVTDLARALLSIACSDVRGTYEIDDCHPGGYSHADLAALIATALGTRPKLLRLPPAVLRAGAAIDSARARLVGGLPTLSFDRARYLAHPDWVVRANAKLPPALWRARVDAATGIAATAAWYRAHGWLR